MILFFYFCSFDTTCIYFVCSYLNCCVYKLQEWLESNTFFRIMHILHRRVPCLFLSLPFLIAENVVTEIIIYISRWWLFPIWYWCSLKTTKPKCTCLSTDKKLLNDNCCTMCKQRIDMSLDAPVSRKDKHGTYLYTCRLVF